MDSFIGLCHDLHIVNVYLTLTGGSFFSVPSSFSIEGIVSSFLLLLLLLLLKKRFGKDSESVSVGCWAYSGEKLQPENTPGTC